MIWIVISPADCASLYLLWEVGGAWPRTPVRKEESGAGKSERGHQVEARRWTLAAVGLELRCHQAEFGMQMIQPAPAARALSQARASLSCVLAQSICGSRSSWKVDLALGTHIILGVLPPSS
jgi:hypothetical protein